MGALDNYILIILSVLACCGIALGANGTPAVYFPPFELRAVGPRGYPNPGSPHILQPQHFAPPRNAENDLVNPTLVSEHPESPATHSEHHEVSKNDSVSVHNLLKALGISEEEEKKVSNQERAATGREYEYPAYPQSPAEYGYPSPSYWPPAPVYQEAPYAYVPPTLVNHSPLSAPKLHFPKIKEKTSDDSLDKPITSKLSNKVSGLIGLVLALLTGSTSEDSEIKGIKDLVINGIVKPLMLAKGGIKSLISKLSIPLIVLLLMNLEVLVLIWWLWEDCQPAPVQHLPVPTIYPYSRPSSSYGFNPYR